MSVVTIHKAKTNLSRLIKKVTAGEEVIIARGDKPVARLVSYRKGKRETPPRLAEQASCASGLNSSSRFRPVNWE